MSSYVIGVATPPATMTFHISEPTSRLHSATGISTADQRAGAAPARAQGQIPKHLLANQNDAWAALTESQCMIGRELRSIM